MLQQDGAAKSKIGPLFQHETACAFTKRRHDITYVRFLLVFYSNFDPNTQFLRYSTSKMQ